MHHIRKILFCFLVLVTVASAQRAQNLDKISRQCAPPNNKLFGVILVQGNGDIVYTPCPNKASKFIGLVDFGTTTFTLPFNVLDKNYVNFQGVPAYLTVGTNTPIVHDTGNIYAVDVEPTYTGDGGAVGVFTFVKQAAGVGTTNNGSDIIGGWFIANNPFDFNQNRILYGVRGEAYQRSSSSSALGAYGGHFQAYVGGNSGGTNTTPLYGVYAKVSGGHNGTSSADNVGGKFIVSNLGGGGVGNINNGIGVYAQFDGGFPITNYINATGMFIGNWVAANGGTYTNTYGIHIDSTIDRGTGLRYSILSESTADSVFSGAVKGVVNPYGAGWNGSAKFTTEDAVYDQLQLIAGGGVSGSGTTNLAAMFTSVNTVGTMPLQFVSSRFTAYRVTATDKFKLEFEGSNTGTGFARIGSVTTQENALTIDQALNRTKVSSRNAFIGDTEAFGNGTLINVDDNNNLISLIGSDTTLEFRQENVYLYTMNRTVTSAGTTGAQVINKPLGSVNFAAGASTLVVTNNSAGTTSLIFITPQAVDTTCKSFSITRAAGSFTITANAACTAETAVAFQVTN